MRLPIPSPGKISPWAGFLSLCLILAASYAAVWAFRNSPLLTVALIALPGIMFLLYARSWKLFIVAVFFMLTGTGHEIVFISQGFWAYPETSFLAVPYYLPLIWGNIAILCVGVYKGIFMIDTNRKLFHKPPHFWRAFIQTGIGMILSVVSIFFFAPTPLTLMLIFLGIDILYITAMRSVPIAIVGVSALICGSVADLIAVPMGIWSYPLEAAANGIPAYIFIGWDVVGLLVAGLYVALDAPDAPLPRWMKDSKA